MTEFRCSASFKRADQLKRWEESETNHQSASPKPSVRIRFSVDCVFLAACAAGDKDEVLRLVQTGADINTPSVDGLTALHQACIDAKLDMVEFLIGLGADVNHSDNEGWTPLHATASCGFLSIAHFLLDNGANITAVNNEGELPVDIAESGAMKMFLEDEIAREGIDCEKARAEEERNLVELSKRWTVIYSEDAEHPDERTGATPLHVAAAKGYLKVMKVLLSNCNVNVDPVDFDGWTPLHAAAHWGQHEAAAMLVEFGADMDIKNFVGQTCLDVSISNMRDHLNELKNKQPNIQYKKKRRPPVPGDLPNKLKKVELKIESKLDSNSINKKTIESESSSSSDYSDSDSDSICDISPDYISSANISDNDKKNALNLNSHSPTLESKPPKSSSGQTTPTILFSPTEPVPDDEPPSWRLNLSRQKPNHNDFPNMEEKDNTINPQSSDSEIILRRTNSCETDKTFYQRYMALTARIKASSCPSIPPAHDSTPSHDTTVVRSASLKDSPLITHNYRILQQDKQKKEIIPPAIPPNIRSSTESVNDQSNATSNNSSPVTPISKLSPGNIFKNFFKSFVPPVRDEESETQRKAHAKRVRETRRSTQGVTLDEIKSAEQLVKKKNSPNPPIKSPVAPETAPSEAPDNHPIHKTETHSVNDTAPTQENEVSEPGSSVAVTLPLHSDSNNDITISATATIATGGPERRPSWRLRVDPGCKFALEDANAPTKNALETPNPGSESPESTEAAPTVTIPLRRTSTSSTNKKDDDKEIEARGATQAAQNVIQRRRRPKRRSTGVVNIDMDEIASDRQNSDGTESGTDSTEQQILYTMSRRDLNNTGRYISRPRSLGLLSPSLNSQSSHSLYSNGSRSYDHGLRGYEQYSYNPYTNNYNSSLYRNSLPYNNVSSTPDSMYGSSYGSKFSSYAGKKRVPSHSTLSSLNLMTGYKGLNKPEKQTYQYNPYTPSISKDYGAPIKPERKSRQASRSSSFNKPRSRSIGSSHDSMGSRSTSLSSLPFDTSEGYISGSARESLSKEENGEIDYKALWESSQIEVKRLNDVILGNEKELIEAKNAVEKYTNLVVSENEKREKRERRAMERKLSEMEEELKLQQSLQAENQRLKDENGALIRVISKLSK